MPADINSRLFQPPEEIQGLSVHQSDAPNHHTRDANCVTLQTLHLHDEASGYTSLNQRLEQDTHVYCVISSSLTCRV